MGKAHALGRLGEQAAACLLMDKGYGIIARNYRANGGEVDIIAFKDGLTVFVEVKARASLAFGEAIEAVDERKRKRLTLAAEAFCSAHVYVSDCRFDVIEVYGSKDALRLIHHQEAF